MILTAIVSGSRAAQTPALTERQKALHVLNRLGFGPRAGDVERVEKMGVDEYIRRQLRPESIDDSKTDAEIAKLDTLQMSSSHLSDEYFGDIRRFIQMQMAAGNAMEMKRRYGIEPSKSTSMAKPGPPTMRDLAQRDAIRCMAQLQQAKLIRAAESERQLQEVLVDFWSNHFNIDVRKDACRALIIAFERDAIRPHVLGRFRDLLGATAHSPAMLTYLDNTENSAPRQVSWLERKAVQTFIQYKLGIKAEGFIADTQGLNENYGREVLELHTLGVDGGYTQKDVQEVARCFTGWGTSPFTGSFNFDSGHHDKGEKIVLGHVIPAGGGVEDGEKVLDILASHPSTALHICYELCQRLVSDNPPTELVDRAAKIFLLSDGDLRAVVRTIVTSSYFFSPDAYRAKIKSPFEYAVSGVRATGGTFVIRTDLPDRVQETMEGAALLGYEADKRSAARRKTLKWWVYDLGQPLFAYTAPSGYSENSAKWVSPGALIDRLNFAMALAEQNVTDIRMDPAHLASGVDADQGEDVLNQLSLSLLGEKLSDATRATLLKRALPEPGSGKTVDVTKLTALILGSPDFQRR